LAVHTEDLADGPYIEEAAPFTPKAHYSAGRSPGPLLQAVMQAAEESVGEVAQRGRVTVAGSAAAVVMSTSARRMSQGGEGP
jgi:hypothetical protein